MDHDPDRPAPHRNGVSVAYLLGALGVVLAVCGLGFGAVSALLTPVLG